MAFPPQVLYPDALDSNYTLYEVYNTTESTLSADNQAWSSEIQIVPATVNEIWPSNGFATLEDEIIYYDAVGVNVDGFVNRLKRCARNLGGNTTQFNPAGTSIRGYVMAEHHNQLVSAIINTEQFISTVASMMSTLLNLPQCPDDVGCPSIALNLSSNLPSITCIGPTPNQCVGISTTYSVTVAGTYDTLQVDFGNGQTTTALTGTYSSGQNIDPVITATNVQCTTVATAISRTSNFTPSTVPTPSPYIETCQIPEIPPFAIPTFATPTGFTMPQIIGPYINLSPLSAIASALISIPSFYIPSVISVEVPSIPNISLLVPSMPNISLIVPSLAEISLIVPSMANISIIGNINIPSIISITPVTIPSSITFVSDPDIPSTITFIGAPESGIIPGEIVFISAPQAGTIPSQISFTELPSIPDISFAEFPDIPDISFASLTIPPISFETLNISTTLSILPISISVNWGPTPSLSVNWGSCSCAITVSCVSGDPPAFAPHLDFTNFQDGFNLQASIEPNDIGIPSEITVVFPEEMPKVQIEVPEMPNILMKLEKPLPTEIKIVGTPESIKLDATDIPKSILLDATSLPEAIYLLPKNIPDVISIDGSDLPRTIKVEGIPSVIELKAPEYIPLKLPENIEIPLVYKGGPIPVTFDISNFVGAASDAPRFVILPAPCPKA